MPDGADELDDLRLDIETLRAMIDLSLANGVGGDDVVLRACAYVLNERQTRHDKLEHALQLIADEERALYDPSGDDERQAGQ